MPTWLVVHSAHIEGERHCLYFKGYILFLLIKGLPFIGRMDTKDVFCDVFKVKHKCVQNDESFILTCPQLNFKKYFSTF